jgi:hypothetical protein
VLLVRSSNRPLPVHSKAQREDKRTETTMTTRRRRRRRRKKRRKKIYR